MLQDFAFPFVRKHVYATCYGLGLVLLAVAGWLWWYRVSVTPQRVFWGMISQSLATSGATVQVVEKGGGGSVTQTTQFSLGGRNIAHSLTDFSQGGNHLLTEVIGLPDADYLRYNSINTTERKANGQPLNTSKVVGVWAKSEHAKQSSRSQLLAQAVVGVGLPLGALPVPIGNVAPNERADLIQQMQDKFVYQVSYTDVARKHQNGRLVYTYKINLRQQPYIEVLKSFAKDVGLSQLDSLDPKTVGTDPIAIAITVDARSRQLIGLSYPRQSSFVETYSAYGLPVQTAIPAKTITTDELQKRFSQM